LRAPMGHARSALMVARRRDLESDSELLPSAF